MNHLNHTMKAKTILLAVLSLACFSVTAQVKKTTQKTKPVEVNRTAAKRSSVKDKSIRVKITTDSGIIIVKLYDSTPLHRDNFVKLVNQKFYDSLMFHRIIPDFMIQGGDPMSKNATAGSMLGMGGGDMARIPAEFRPYLFHKKGALAAARDGNPEKASSACQFYIVEGRVSNDKELDMIQQQKGIKFSPEQRQAYTTVGGTPFLDQDYTVFGEVVSGLEVIDKIINVPRDANNRPLGDVRMKMELLK